MLPELPTCALCPNVITPETDSREHIIPNSIGGRAKILGFLCRPCNNARGQTWESELASQFAAIALMHGVKRENGETPPMVFQTVHGEQLLMLVDGTMVPARPLYREQITDTGHTISIMARTLREARKMAEGVQRKYPQSSAAQALATATAGRRYLDSPLNINLVFGGPLAGRSMVKTAVALAHRAGIPHSACEVAMRYLNDENATTAPFGHFHTRDLVAQRPPEHTFHCVSVLGDPEKRRLIAYVEYFGLARIVALLSEAYTGPVIQSTYALDPGTGNELNLSVDLSLSEDEFEQAVAGFAMPDGSFSKTADYALPIILRRAQQREIARASEEAFVHAADTLGIQLGDEILPVHAAPFSQAYANFLAPLITRLIKG